MEKVLQANHEKTQLVISNHETTMYPPKGQKTSANVNQNPDT